MSFKKFKKLLQIHWFLISSVAILLFATVLRFYNFSNRWVLAGDQAHFALVGKYMVEEKVLPLLGPFSSAGPFQTGGEWYWFVALGSISKFLGVTAPWIFLVVTYVIFVAIMIFIGKRMEGKLFGIVVGCLAAVSTGEIFQSVNLSNQSPIPLFSALSILFMVFYLETKKIKHLFLMSLMVGIASSIHLQGVALIGLIISTVVFGRFPGVLGLLVIPLGIAIPWIPVLIADSQNKFTNTNNMIYYFFFEKNKASFEVLGRRWLTFVTVFVPYSWSFAIGGILATGYLMGLLALGLGIYAVFKRNIKRQWVVLFVATFIMYVILRYTRTPLFESFYVFTHPFIILLTGWVLIQIYKFKKLIAIILFFGLLMTSLYADFMELTKVKFNTNATRPLSQMHVLSKKLPDKKFAIYDYKFDTSAYSQSLALYLYDSDKIDDDGVKIGYSNTNTFKYPVVLSEGAFTLYNISSLTDEKLKSEKWIPVNPSAIYRSGQDWYKK